MSPHDRVTPELLHETTKLVVNTQSGSQLQVQHKVRVGFTTARQLLDALTARGVLGPDPGSAPREVLYRTDQLDQALDRANEPSSS